MTKVTIPATIEEATAGLDGIDRLLVAKEWERAAIVYAFTNAGGKPGPKGDRMDTHTISAREFADKRIVGLTDKNTVAEYAKAWQWAIDNGMATEVKPGDTVALPTIAWPPGIIDHKRGAHTSEVIPGIRKMIEDDPDTVQKIIRDRPEIADKLAEQVAATPGTRWRAETIIRETKPEPTHRSEPREANKAVEAVINAINTFWIHPITHNGRQMTYRDVIEIVRDNPDAVLQGSLAPTASLHVGLARALDGMAAEARRLAEPLLIEAGGDE